MSWFPFNHQIELAREGYDILREHMICYLAMEERTGKTLTAILMAEMCSNVEKVVVLTTKKALDGWNETLENYSSTVDITVLNYHQAGKLSADYDLAILDEAHNYISAIPKRVRGDVKYSKIWKDVHKIVKNIPIIYSSATPHAQGHHQLYNQFALSKWSPWKQYKNFYSWFDKYGIPETSWVAGGHQVPVYTNTKADLCTADVNHLFITKTRKELNFEHEPEDKIHYIELDEVTKSAYNQLLKKKVLTFADGIELVADTPMKLRTSLHMLEGGVAKLSNVPKDIWKKWPQNRPSQIKIKDRETQSADIYTILKNDEKCRYIKSKFGDTGQLIIFYHYIADRLKLESQFTKAKLLQGITNAEGVDLSMYDTVVVYSQDFRTAKHTQRRARQANINRKKEIIVHYILVKDAVSEQVYETVSRNKENFVDSVFERIEI